jgi:hypothetical protein
MEANLGEILGAIGIKIATRQFNATIPAGPFFQRLQVCMSQRKIRNVNL